jgi:polar amino acid transport system substrate-binding protein
LAKESPNHLTIIFCFTLLFNCVPAFSEVYRLKVAVPPFAPFAYFKESNECKGASVKILDDIAQLAGIQFQHVRYPYARILTSLKNGELDMALIFKNATVINNVEFIGPVSKSRVVVLTKLSNPIKQYQGLHALNAIAAIRKAQFESQFDQDQQLNKSPVESYRQGLQMFKIEHVDAVVGSISGLEYNMKQLNMSAELLNQAFVLGHKEWWLHISNRSPLIKENSNIKSKIKKAVNKIYRERLSYEVYKQQIKDCQI